MPRMAGGSTTGTAVRVGIGQGRTQLAVSTGVTRPTPRAETGNGALAGPVEGSSA